MFPPTFRSFPFRVSLPHLSADVVRATPDGAIVGGWLSNAFGRAGASGVNLYSIIVATLGAVVFLWIWKALTGRRAV